MLAEEYVREKLREMSREASRTPNVPVDGVSFASPAARSLGRLLCQMGERLQRAGGYRECDAQAGRPKEQSLRLGRTG